MYKVQYGDTPTSIAERFTRNPQAVDDLIEANPHKALTLVDGKKTFATLHIGEVLVFPEAWGDGTLGRGGGRGGGFRGGARTMAHAPVHTTAPVAGHLPPHHPVPHSHPTPHPWRRWRGFFGGGWWGGWPWWYWPWYDVTVTNVPCGWLDMAIEQVPSGVLEALRQGQFNPGQDAAMWSATVDGRLWRYYADASFRSADFEAALAKGYQVFYYIDCSS